MEQHNNPDQRGTNPLRYLFGKTWHYSAGNRGKIVQYWTMFLVANTISLAVYPLAMRKIVDVIQHDKGITSGNIKLLMELLMVTFATQMIFWALHGPARVIERRNAFKARANYRKHLLKGVMSLPMEWHTSHHSGDTIDKVEKGANGLYDFSQDSFEVLYATVQLLVSYGMLTYFSRPAGFIVVAMTFITARITMSFDKVLVQQYRQLNWRENNISERTFDAISNIATVIILRVERPVFEAIGGKIDEPLDLFHKNSKRNEMKWFLMSVCCNLTTVLVLGFYFWGHIGTTDGVLLGNVYILMQYLGKINETFGKFASMYGNILQRRAKVTNAEELAQDFKAESFTNHVLPPQWNTLQIDGLSFSYQQREGSELHLDNVSLSITHGERIAFIGKSGSGKSTLLKLIRDLYHPERVTLSVDGIPIPQGLEGISRAIALVLQDPEIFGTDVGENITLGAEYEPGLIRHYTDMACFTEVIGKLPNGLASSINERGVNLSGGQQQRLALARGLLACHDKDIVLLDEPTSSLDAATEMNVYRNILHGFVGKTIISSVHRLHLLPLFDRICFMSEGRILASGSLNELMLTCPEFQELWQKYHQNLHQAVAS